MRNNVNKYYGVYASNGLGVFTNYTNIVNDPYIRGEHVKGFCDQEEAEEYAMDGFSLLHGVDSLMVTVPDFNKIRLNFFYFKKTEQRPPNTAKQQKMQQEQQQLSKYAYEGGLINGKHISKAISILTEDEKETYILYGTFKEVQS